MTSAVARAAAALPPAVPAERPQTAKARTLADFMWRGQRYRPGEIIEAPIDDLAKLFRAGVVTFT